MSPVILKSKYELLNLESENIISYTHLGKTHYSAIPVQIVKYKTEYLSSALVRGLIQTAERLMTVKDANVLTLIDYFYDGKNFFAIYEYPENYMSLETFLKKEKTWNLKIHWDITTQVLSALIKLEHEGLVYGNLNLSSVLISTDYKVKLDKVALPLAIMKHNWSQFQLIEDCIFYPPEFIKDQHYTHHSDMYSFGVLLYFLFSKTWPYQYVLKLDALKKELVKEPLPFKRLDTKLPNRLGGIIGQCLQHDPQSRFSTFLELIKTYKGKVEFDPISKASSKQMRTELEKELAEERKVVKKKRLRILYIISGFFGFFVLLYALYVSYLTAIPEKEVPDVIGMTRFEAIELLKKQKLDSIIAGARIHASYEEGRVIETKPPSGRLVKQNRQVRLFISKGTGPILIPDLVGLSREQVEEVVEKNNFDIRIVKELYSIQYAKGVVVSQFPTPSTFAEPGGEIEVVISKGFPIEMTVSKVKNSFFKNKENLREINLSFFILEEWASQQVDIYFYSNGKQEKVYSDIHQPGDAKTLSFELEVGGVLEVYFNDEKGFSQTIQESNFLTE